MAFQQKSGKCGCADHSYDDGYDDSEDDSSSDSCELESSSEEEQGAGDKEPKRKDDKKKDILDILNDDDDDDGCSCNDSEEDEQEEVETGPKTTILVIDEFFVDIFAESPKFRMRSETVTMEENLDGITTKYSKKKPEVKPQAPRITHRAGSWITEITPPQFGWLKNDVQIFVPVDWEPTEINEKVKAIRLEAQRFIQEKEDFVENNKEAIAAAVNGSEEPFDGEPRHMCLNVNGTTCQLLIDPKCKFLVDQPTEPQDPDGPLALQIYKRKDADIESNVNNFEVNFMTPNLENDEKQIVLDEKMKHVNAHSKDTQCEEKDFPTVQPPAKGKKGKK